MLQRVRDYSFKVTKKGLEDPSPPRNLLSWVSCSRDILHYSASLNISSRYLKTHHLDSPLWFSFPSFHHNQQTFHSGRSTQGRICKPAFQSKMLTFNWGSTFVFLFHCGVWYSSVICPRWALQSHSAFSSTPSLYLRINSESCWFHSHPWPLLALSRYAVPCFLAVWLRNQLICKRLWRNLKKIPLNNHGLDQE